MTERAQHRNGGYLLVACAAAGWGTWPLILRHASMPATLQSAIVMLVMTVGSLPFMLRDRVPVRASLRQWLVVGWLGISDALNVVLFFAAYQRTTVAIAVLTHYLTPIFIAVAAPFVLAEPFRKKTALALTISFAGLVLLLQPWNSSLSSRDLVGAALGAGSAVFYASNVLFNKGLAGAFSASELGFFHGLVAVPLLWALVPHGVLAETPTGSIATVAVAALGPGLLGGLLFVWGLRRIAASRASVLTLLEPLVAVGLAAACLGQALGAVQIVGGALILLGALLVVMIKPLRRATVAQIE